MIPFINAELISSLYGKELCLARKNGLDNVVEPISSLSILPGGSASSGFSWSVSDDGLMITDGIDVINFSGIFQANGMSFLVGTDKKDDTRPDSNRILFESARMSSKKVLYMISSNEIYGKHTIDRCIASLLSSEISSADICVVMGSSNGSGHVRPDGVSVFCTGISKKGYTALIAYEKIKESKPGYDFVFLINDTCVALSGLKSRVDALEVGIPFDLISVGSIGDSCEIGLYSSRMCNLISGSLSNAPILYNQVVSSSNLVVGLSTNRKMPYVIEKVRDVYGNGTSREVRLYKEIGIKKFSSVGAKRQLP
jgi:hypothetical protein